MIEFELDLARNLWKLHAQLRKGTYQVNSCHHFTIHAPRTRKIWALSFCVRVSSTARATMCSDHGLKSGYGSVARSLALLVYSRRQGFF